SEWSLCSGPHCQLIVFPFSDSRPWLKWRVRDVSDRVIRRKLLIRDLESLLDRANRLASHAIAGCVLLQIIKQLFIARLPGSLPVNGNRFLRLYRGLPIRRNDTDEVAVANNFHTRNCFGSFRVGGNKLCFQRRWSNDTAV